MKTLVATLILVFALCGHASASSNPTQSQAAFVNAFVAAMHSKNTTGLMALMHPKDRPCVTDKTRAFYQYIVTQQSGSFPKQKVQEISVTQVKAKDEPSLWQFLPEKMFPYPVLPAARIQINFGFGPDGYLGLDELEVAPSGGKWYWVTACPTAEGMALVRKMQKKASH
jgi:hypothetical protein